MGPKLRYSVVMLAIGRREANAQLMNVTDTIAQLQRSLESVQQSITRHTGVLLYLCVLLLVVI